MCKCKVGNPKRSSRFICLKHLGINHIGDGLQRNGNQREKYHIKDMFCIVCGSVEKCLEIRFCDDMEEILDRAEELHREMYC